MAARYLSDHSSPLCSLNTKRPRHETKEICYRQLKVLDFDALRLDLEESDLCSSVYRDLNDTYLSINTLYSSGKACAVEEDGQSL